MTNRKCPLTFCQAGPGEPCVSSNGRIRSEHAARRVAVVQVDMTISDAVDTTRNPLLDWETLHYTRAEIARLEQRLRELYGHRREMIIEMAGDSMTRREIAAWWRISGPRVTGIINGGSKWRKPDGDTL